MGAQTQYVVTLTSALTLQTDASVGVNSLDTGSLTDAKGYYVYLICKENLADPALIMSLTAPFPTANYPADYVMRSAPIFFIHIYTDSTLMVRDFIHQLDGWVSFEQNDQLLSNGTATSTTAISLANHFPVHCYAKIRFRAKNTGTNNCTVTLRGYVQGAGDHAMMQVAAIDGDASGQWDDVQQQVEFPVTANLATSLYYDWVNAPTGGLTVWAAGFKMSTY